MTIENSFRIMLKGIKIDDRTEGYVRKKVGSISKMLDKIVRSEVEISLDKKGKFTVEAMVKTPYKLYRAENTTESIEGSVDLVEDELKEQIRKDLDKVRTLRKRGRMSLKKKITVAQEARFRK